jgi:hypothetical protein
MKTKFKITAIIAATFLLGVVLGVVGRGAFLRQGRERFDATERAELLLSHVNEAVQPDSAEKPKVEAIIKSTAGKIDVLFDHHREQLSVIMDSMESQLSAVLTPEQQQRLSEELSAVTRRQRDRRPNIGASLAFPYEYAERLQEELDLDSVQTERLLEIARASHDQLIREAQAWKNDPHVAEKLRENFINDTNGKIEALLNPKQKEQFREMEQERERFVEEEMEEEEH